LNALSSFVGLQRNNGPFCIVCCLTDYLGSEECIPLPTLASAGLDTGREAVSNAHSEERASCLYVKRILGSVEIDVCVFVCPEHSLNV